MLGGIKKNGTGSKEGIVGSKSFDGSVFTFGRVDEVRNKAFDAGETPGIMTSKERNSDSLCNVSDGSSSAQKFESRTVRKGPLSFGENQNAKVEAGFQDEEIPGFESTVGSEDMVLKNGILSSNSAKVENVGKIVGNAIDEVSDVRKSRVRALKKTPLGSEVKLGKRKNDKLEVGLQNEVIPGFERTSGSKNIVPKRSGETTITSKASNNQDSVDVSKKASMRKSATKQRSGLKRSRESKTETVAKRKASSGNFPKEEDSSKSELLTSNKRLEKKNSSVENTKNL